MKSDGEIEQDVKEELKWNPDLDATDIAVAVKDGVVALTVLPRVTLTNTRPRWLQSASSASSE